MRPLRAAVVGVGHLGRFHAQKYARSPNVILAAVVDVDAERAQRIAAEYGAEAYTDHRMLCGRVDVASVVVPTSHHYQVASDLIGAGIHVLVEKPFTATVTEGQQLVALSSGEGCVLQVGHVERFNPVVRALSERVDAPLFIESHRISPFKNRGVDVNVVLDLMIHDIDLILNLVDAPVLRIDASGGPVLSSQIDIANARIQFTTGCVANVTASRVSAKSERRMRVFQRQSYLSADLGNRTLDVYRKASMPNALGSAKVECDRLTLTAGDALEAEIRSFLACVHTGRPPLVSGEDGLQALKTAAEVIQQIESNPLPSAGREQAFSARGWQL